jgi:hypothetical protein
MRFYKIALDNTIDEIKAHPFNGCAVFNFKLPSLLQFNKKIE